MSLVWSFQATKNMTWHLLVITVPWNDKINERQHGNTKQTSKMFRSGRAEICFSLALKKRSLSLGLIFFREELPTIAIYNFQFLLRWLFVRESSKLMRFSNRNKIILLLYLRLFGMKNSHEKYRLENLSRFCYPRPNPHETRSKKNCPLRCETWKINKNYSLRSKLLSRKLITECLIYIFLLSLRFISGLFMPH